jgi:hypothetical protein
MPHGEPAHPHLAARMLRVVVIRACGYLRMLDDNPGSGAIRDYFTKIGLRKPGLVLR